MPDAMPSCAKKLHHVEQIARMLAIQCGNRLAAVHVLQRHHRDVHVGQQHVAGGRHEGGAPHGPHRAAHHHVDFDLDFNATPAHQQLGLTRDGRRDMCQEPMLVQALYRLRTASLMRANACARGSV